MYYHHYINLVKLRVGGAVGLLTEEFIQVFVAHLVAVSPNHESSLIADMGSSFHHTVAILRITERLYIQTDKVVEGFHHINMGIYQLIILGCLDRHDKRIFKPFQVEEISLGFCIEHITEEIGFLEISLAILVIEVESLVLWL